MIRAKQARRTQSLLFLTFVFFFIPYAVRAGRVDHQMHHSKKT